MKFGANTFIYHSPFSTDEHLYLVEKYKQMGLDLFEVAVEDPGLIDLEALKAALDANQMGVIVCGAFGPDQTLVAVMVGDVEAQVWRPKKVFRPSN